MFGDLGPHLPLVAGLAQLENGDNQFCCDAVGIKVALQQVRQQAAPLGAYCLDPLWVQRPVDHCTDLGDWLTRIGGTGVLDSDCLAPESKGSAPPTPAVAASLVAACLVRLLEARPVDHCLG